MTTYYKFLTEDMKPPQATSEYRFREGVWTKKTKPVICASGWHVCKPGSEIEHLGARCFIVEGRGEMVEGDTKLAFESIRLIKECLDWNAKNQRLFACWCAMRALSSIENPDPRSLEAVEVAERHVNGLATDEELAAAWDAASAAARAAASAAASAAAWDAASAAARDAAAAAARAAAWDAERKVQNNRLLEILRGDASDDAKAEREVVG